MSKTPTILVFAGHDPSGGAGIQADIETIAALGGHCCPIITTYTIQNSQSFLNAQAVETDWLQKQTEHLLKDISPDAIKIGLITDQQIVHYLSSVIKQFPNIPVVYDPVLRSGSGTDLSSNELLITLRSVLLPLINVLTPNQYEAKILSGKTDLDNVAADLIKLGCEHVLITGTDAASEQIEHRHYDQSHQLNSFTCKKYPGTFHGSGCTLSAAIATFLAKKLDVAISIKQAHEFTLQAIKAGQQVGNGQKYLKRIINQTSNIN